MNTKAFEQWLQQQAQTIVRYRQIEKGNILAEYNALKKVVESTEFQTKKKELTTTHYADTQEGKTMAAYKSLKWNTSVMLYNLLKKEAYKEKAEVAEYLALSEKIQTPEFQQANAFWKNPKRWFTTPESQEEKRYQELMKHADIVFFFAHTKEEVAELESFNMVWAEEFETAHLADVWQTGFLYPSKALKANHSHVNEGQAYTQGKNTQVAIQLSFLKKLIFPLAYQNKYASDGYSYFRPRTKVMRRNPLRCQTCRRSNQRPYQIHLHRQQ
jgi:hypothetical protein